MRGGLGLFGLWKLLTLPPGNPLRALPPPRCRRRRRGVTVAPTPSHSLSLCPPILSARRRRLGLPLSATVGGRTEYRLRFNLYANECLVFTEPRADRLCLGHNFRVPTYNKRGDCRAAAARRVSLAEAPREIAG